MRTTNYIALALASLIATTLSAPTPRPQVTGILGSITNPSAGDDNTITGNGDKNGNGNGNNNEAGNGNGNKNAAGDGNEAGNGNSFDLDGILRERGLMDDVEKSVTGVLGSVTNPSAGDGNDIEGNGDGNGNGNGNGNAAGNGNGNGNVAGSGNEAGNGNEFNLKV